MLREGSAEDGLVDILEPAEAQKLLGRLVIAIRTDGQLRRPPQASRALPNPVPDEPGRTSPRTDGSALPAPGNEVRKSDPAEPGPQAHVGSLPTSEWKQFVQPAHDSGNHLRPVAARVRHRFVEERFQRFHVDVATSHFRGQASDLFRYQPGIVRSAKILTWRKSNGGPDTPKLTHQLSPQEPPPDSGPRGRARDVSG